MNVLVSHYGLPSILLSSSLIVIHDVYPELRRARILALYQCAGRLRLASSPFDAHANQRHSSEGPDPEITHDPGAKLGRWVLLGPLSLPSQWSKRFEAPHARMYVGREGGNKLTLPGSYNKLGLKSGRRV